jgi:hypothetical protein
VPLTAPTVSIGLTADVDVTPAGIPLAVPTVSVVAALDVGVEPATIPVTVPTITITGIEQSVDITPAVITIIPVGGVPMAELDLDSPLGASTDTGTGATVTSTATGVTITSTRTGVTVD